MSRTGALMATTIGFAACIAALVALLAWHNNPASARVTTASGSTITVNTAADESNTDGDCSLREAITAANTNTAVDACRAGRRRATRSNSPLARGLPSF
jgi:CSLREA domain-containing protein